MLLLLNEDQKTERFYDTTGRLVDASIGFGLIELIELDANYINAISETAKFLSPENVRRITNKGYGDSVEDLKDHLLEAARSVHLYFTTIKPSPKTYGVERPSQEMIDKDIEFIYSIKENIDKLKDIVAKFLDVDCDVEIKELNNAQKLYILKYYWSMIFKEPSIEIIFSSGFNEKLSEENSDHRAHITTLLNSGNIRDAATEIKEENIGFQHLYKCSVIDVCYIEIVKMITLGISVRKCHNCGKYFVMAGRTDTEYCDRIAHGYSDKTCKDVGPLKNYAERINSNPLLLAYQKAYKAKHAELRKITNPAKYEEEKEKLKKWRISAKASAEKGEILEEFKKWLK